MVPSMRPAVAHGRRSVSDCPPGSIASVRSAFAYRGPAREAVHRLKFSGWRGVGEALAAALAEIGPPPADAVTWVPLAPRRRAERGFDQARVLAQALARDLQLPAAAYVRRTTATAPQSRRTREERLRAMAGVFARIPHRPAPPRLLLVDDVLTTGATVSACAAALVQGGAREIHVLTACRSFGTLARPAAGTTRFAPAVKPCLYSRGAPVRVCGCPGTNPGSRCQPRAKRPT